MVKKTKQKHQLRHAVVGTLGALGFMTLTTQAASASQVTVKPGDTVWGIAQQHGLTTKSIEDANPTTVKKISSTVDLIQVGQKLNLPDGHNNSGSTAGNTGATMGSQANNTVSGVSTSVKSITDAPSVEQENVLPTNQSVSQGSAVQGNNSPVNQPVSVSSGASQAANVGSVANASQSNAPVQYQARTQESNAAVMAGQAQPSNVTITGGQQVSATAQPVVSQPIAQPVSAASEAQTAVAIPQTSQQVTVNNQSVQAQPSQAPVSTAPSQPAMPSTPASAVQSAPQVSQPQQSQQVQPSQPAAATSQAPQSSTGTDLQSGSIVSLATKIATSNSVPYVWGGNSLNGMDCSGFVDYVYAHAENKQLPHNSTMLESYVNQHAVSEAQPGDILFWGNHGSSYHVAIYTGNNQYAAAAQPGTNVSLYTLSPYFAPSFAGTVK